jgi:hypothetical protein
MERCPYLQLWRKLAHVVQRQVSQLPAVLNVQVLDLCDDREWHRQARQRERVGQTSKRLRSSSAPGQFLSSTSIASSVSRKQPEKLTVCSLGQIRDTCRRSCERGILVSIH